MRKFLALFVVGLFFVSGVYADGFSKKGKTAGVEVEYSTAKPLVVGTNDFTISLSKGDTPLKGAEVIMKVFMPEMPGMPYMEYIGEAKESGEGVYEVMINFSMGGTWQVRIEFESEGKKYRYKSSVII